MLDGFSNFERFELPMSNFENDNDIETTFSKTDCLESSESLNMDKLFEQNEKGCYLTEERMRLIAQQMNFIEDSRFADYVKDKKVLNKRIMAKRVKEQNEFENKNIRNYLNKDGQSIDSGKQKASSLKFGDKNRIKKGGEFKNRSTDSPFKPGGGFRKSKLLPVKSYLISTSDIKVSIVDYNKMVRLAFPIIALKDKKKHQFAPKRIMDFILPLETSVYKENIEERNMFSYFASLMKYKEITSIQRTDTCAMIHLKEKNPFDFMVSDYIKNTEYSIKWLKGQNKFDAFQLSHYLDTFVNKRMLGEISTLAIASLSWEKKYINQLDLKTRHFLNSRPSFSMVSHIDMMRRRYETTMIKIENKFESLFNFDLTSTENIIYSLDNFKTDNWIGFFLDVFSRENSNKFDELNRMYNRGDSSDTEKSSIFQTEPLYTNFPISFTDNLIYFKEMENNCLEGQRLVVGIWEESWSENHEIYQETTWVIM